MGDKKKMTKDELRKEAEELYKDLYAHKLGAISIIDVICKMAEPREKQIAELSKHILELKKDKEELVDKCRELEQQIKKMKCCENCAWWYRLPNGQRDCAETCENLDNWSFRKP